MISKLIYEYDNNQDKYFENSNNIYISVHLTNSFEFKIIKTLITALGLRFSGSKNAEHSIFVLDKQKLFDTKYNKSKNLIKNLTHIKLINLYFPEIYKQPLTDQFSGFELCLFRSDNIENNISIIEQKLMKLNINKECISSVINNNGQDSYMFIQMTDINLAEKVLEDMSKVNFLRFILPFSKINYSILN